MVLRYLLLSFPLHLCAIKVRVSLPNRPTTGAASLLFVAAEPSSQLTLTALIQCEHPSYSYAWLNAYSPLL